MSSFKPGFVLLVLTQVSDLNFEHGIIKFLKPIFYLTVSHLNSLAEDLFIVDNTDYPWKSLLNCAWVTFLIYYIFFLRLLSWVLVSILPLSMLVV